MILQHTENPPDVNPLWDLKATNISSKPPATAKLQCLNPMEDGWVPIHGGVGLLLSECERD